jgi:hypothetical protein
VRAAHDDASPALGEPRLIERLAVAQEAVDEQAARDEALERAGSEARAARRAVDGEREAPAAGCVRQRRALQMAGSGQRTEGG